MLEVDPPSCGRSANRRLAARISRSGRESDESRFSGCGSEGFRYANRSSSLLKMKLLISVSPFVKRFWRRALTLWKYELPAALFCSVTPLSGNCGKGIVSCCNATVDEFNEPPLGSKPLNGFATSPVSRVLTVLSRVSDVLKSWRGMKLLLELIGSCVVWLPI